MWVEIVPCLPLLTNLGNSSQSVRKNIYQSYLALPSFFEFLYPFSNILSGTFFRLIERKKGRENFECEYYSSSGTVDYLAKLKKNHPSTNPMIRYLNISSIRNKTVQLNDICKTCPAKTLCIESFETKLNSNFPNVQVHLPDYQILSFLRDRNSSGGFNCLHCIKNEVFY